jgi:N6-adenosine-specific RNA methylase IME4
METMNETAKEGKKYPIIYVDAPWDSTTWPLERMRGLPLEKWAAPDALLLMWVPVALVPDALLLLEIWKFEYEGLLAWRKPKDDLEGYWFRCDCEFILIGKRGSVKTTYLFRHTLYEGSRSEGSYKPEGFRRLLLDSGCLAFDKVVPHLDLFGAYWQRIFPEYEKKDWDFLEG